MAPSLDTVRIVCADLHKSARFYRLLGIELSETPDAALLAARVNGLRFVLFKEERMAQISSEWVVPVGQRVAIAFRCASPRDVDATFYKIVQSGFRSVDVAPYDAQWGQRFASVFDPDGNVVDLFADLQ